MFKVDFYLFCFNSIIYAYIVCFLYYLKCDISHVFVNFIV
ncbi:hypothetical protein PROVRETT_07691 [Providencia rettgeri DSM 1131]|nr:hypothetical protein PROVRETT_07691 [Providencia rettgeri DSM 1131]